MSQDLITSDQVAVLTRVEIDSQIATARAFPRDMEKVYAKALQMVTFNQEIAESCIYALPRAGKTLTGASVRLAEIMINAWGHIHCSTQVIANNGKFISVEAIVIDRENNNIYREVVERSIMTSAKGGKTPQTFSTDMIQTTAAAGASIALRRAAFRMFRAFVNPIYEAAKQAALGKGKNNVDVRDKAIAQFQKAGIAPEKIFNYFGIEKKEDLTSDHLEFMIGVKNAIIEGELSKENAFDPNYEGDKTESKADEVNNLLGNESQN